MARFVSPRASNAKHQREAICPALNLQTGACGDAAKFVDTTNTPSLNAQIAVLMPLERKRYEAPPARPARLVQSFC
eukprot:SAG31_NODE_4877_length_2890_cov_1.569330_3_plen_76_part_00